MNQNIQGLYNRLEIIKNLIAIGEVEEVDTHCRRLKVFAEDKAIAMVISLLNGKRFEEAIDSIEEYINKSKSLISAEQPAVLALRMEVLVLEKRFAELEEVKASLESRIDEFQIAYRKELGSLVDELLRLRKEALAREAEANPGRKNEYEEAKKAHEEYQDALRGMFRESRFELNAEERDSLKTSFRKACKLCHPDLVAPENQKKAQEIFIELRKAYNANNLDRVNELLKHLEEGNPLRIFAAGTKETLAMERDRLRRKLLEIEREIAQIRKAELFILVSSIHNWVAYFKDKKKELVREINQIKARTK